MEEPVSDTRQPGTNTVNKSFRQSFIENTLHVLSARLRDTTAAPVCEPVDILCSKDQANVSQETEDFGESALTLSQLRVMNQYLAHLDHMLSDSKSLQSGIRFMARDGFWPAGLSASLTPASHVSGMSPSELFNGIVQAKCLDRDAVRELLSSVPGDWKEYDVDVCDLTLRGRSGLLAQGSFENWMTDHAGWRSCGMVYPLAVAARYRRDPSLWLTHEQLGSELGKAFSVFLASASEPDAVSSGALVRESENLANLWHHTDGLSVEARDRLVGLFDLACVRMGVKSNGLQGGADGFDLESTLSGFRTDAQVETSTRRPKTKGLVDATVHENNRAAWPHLNRRIQAAFPPSLLYAGLSRANKPTWGFERLTLRVTTAGSQNRLHPGLAVHFVEGEMGCVLPADIRSQERSLHRRCRVHDVLWRLGALALSPEVGRVMTGVKNAECHTVMRHMDSVESSHGPGESEYSRVIRSMETAMQPTEVRGVDGLNEALPATYVAWRIDLPTVTLRTQGDSPDPSAMVGWTSTEHLRKSVTKGSCKRSAVAAGYATRESQVDEAGVRRLILEHFTKNLREEAGNSHARNTTMAEAALCFTLDPPENKRSTLPLGGRNKWESDGIDQRYAEVQNADNGFRLRDWAAVHCDTRSGCTWQCRLASHVVHTKDMFHSTLSWLDDAGNLRRVAVKATLPFERRVLKGSGLSSALEGCFKHEPGLLPVHKLSAKVARKDLEFYHPDDNRSIIVYSSPQNANSLEVAIFQTQARE